mgnify:CR=1 FL=1
MNLPYPHDAVLIAGRLIYSGAALPWSDRAFLHGVRGSVRLNQMEVWRIASIVARHGTGVGHVTR